MIAAIRPDDWNFPLLLHMLGAMVLVGALVLALTALVSLRRAAGAGGPSLPMLRLGFRSLLFGAIPAFIVMRAAAEWIRSKEGFEGDNDPAWIGLGYTVSDLGLLLLLAATIIAGLGLRRAARASGETGGSGGVTATVVIISIMLIAYVVAIWAMTTKPL
jgi:hypothetical protein